jgi:NADH-quinone oxidoreductase subunit K
MHAVYPLVLAALLFAIGVYGLLARRNAITVLMAIELLLNAANLNLVAFSAILRDQLHVGQVFPLFIITIAAAETGVGIAIVLLVFRLRGSADIDRQRLLGDTAVDSEVDSEVASDEGVPIP